MINWSSFPFQLLPNGQICGFNGLFNPMMITGTRQDLQVVSVNESQGEVTIICNDIPAELLSLIDTKLYLYAGNGIYDGTYTITEATFGSVTTFKCSEIPLGLGNAVGGYVNLKVRANWYTQFEITTYQPLKVFTAKYRDDLKGRLSIDISSMFRGLMSFEDTFAYDVENSRDLNLSRRFSLRWKELYTGLVSEYGLRHPFYFAVVNGAKQLGDDEGSNYRDYYSSLSDITHKGKFLTLFEKPVYWVGYPFDLQFIYPGFESSGILPTSYPRLLRRQGEYGLNGNLLLFSEAALDNSIVNMGYINRMKMRESGSYNLIHVSRVTVRVDSFGPDDFGDNWYADDYWVTLAPADPGEYDITEEKDVEIRQECVDSPFYIKWFHSLGGWDYWMFEKVQFYERNVYDSDRYNPVVTNIKTATSREDFIGKKARREVTCGGSVSTQQMVALEEMLSSPKIYRLDIDAFEGSPSVIKWQVIKLKPKSFKTVQTDINRHDLEVEFELQDIYLQSNI